jgi:hypothetical protein
VSMPSSPGKMDLSALSGLKRRVLQPVPSAEATLEPVLEAPETSLAPEPAPVPAIPPLLPGTQTKRGT